METPRKLHRIELTKIDVKDFERLLDEHLVGITQGTVEIALAIGSVVGHAALADALRLRFIADSSPRSPTAAHLLDATFQAVQQHAERGRPSRT